MRAYFIKTVDFMQEKLYQQDLDSKRERQLMLDIMRVNDLKEKEKQEDEEDLSQQHQNPDVSMTEELGKIDENTEIFNYEINVKSKAFDDMHDKLINLNAELEITKIAQIQAEKELQAVRDSKELLKNENLMLKNSLKEYQEPELSNNLAIDEGTKNDSTFSEGGSEISSHSNIYMDRISLLESVNTNVNFKLEQKVQDSNFLLSALKSYDQKMKETLNFLVKHCEERFEKYKRKLDKMSKELKYFKENSSKVNYYYSNVVTKRLADRITFKITK